jgi:hypothetical protein
VLGDVRLCLEFYAKRCSRIYRILGKDTVRHLPKRYHEPYHKEGFAFEVKV